MNRGKSESDFTRYGTRELFPAREGVYLARGIWGDLRLRRIDVYYHPIKGFSCFVDDYGGAGNGTNDETDCHVSVQMTGLEFVRRVRDL